MNGVSVAARCPAKINLALRVIDRRPDGFHELDTIFQTIDLWDRVEARPAADLSVSCDSGAVPPGEGNLVLRAARLVHRELGLGGTVGAALHLRKRIPVQGGLGGGSSDAAGTIRLLERLWGHELRTETRWRVAAALGADIPFFLTGGTARGRGRGDRIEPLPPLAEQSLVLGLPPFGVPTADAFREVHARLTLPGIGVSLPRLSAHKWPGEKDFSFAANDLELVVFPRYPELRRFRDALLSAGARVALLSGSGSTLFGVFDDGPAALDGAARLGRGFPAWNVVPTRTVDRPAGEPDDAGGDG